MRPKRTSVGALLLLLCSGSSVQGQFTAGKEEYLVRHISDTLSLRAFAYGVVFDNWSTTYQRLRNVHGVPTSEESFASLVNLALREYDVSHLQLLSPRQARLRASGRQSGVGVRVLAEPDGLLVTEVVDGSPADVAGIRRGDVITKVDGNSARIDSVNAATGRRVEWLHSDHPRAATLVPTGFRRASLDRLAWQPNGFAVIRVNSFNQQLYNRERIDSLFQAADSARGLILDLRSNGGGFAENVAHLLGHLLPRPTVIGRVLYREQFDSLRLPKDTALPIDSLAKAAGDSSLSMSGRPSAFAKPLVVLVDRWSGSGGELAPAALQVLGRGLILGTRTYGGVRVSDFVEVGEGFLLQFPTAEMLAPDGQSIEGVGVQPDVVLTSRETANDQIVIAAARALLQQRLRGGERNR